MKAIILSAGQGRRLLPLTAERPKCLLPFAGRSLLQWQIRALAENGVEEVIVVTGFASRAVEEAVARMAEPAVRVRSIFNPFFAVADNIASCFVARHEMGGEFLLLNGDTLVDPTIVARLLANRTASILVSIDRKGRYDEDDMKVSLDDKRLKAIGKTLPIDEVDAESIGFLKFDGQGAELFRHGIDAVLREPSGLNRFYLSVIHEIARIAHVGTVDISGRSWSEVDFPADLKRADALASTWSAEPWATPVSRLSATA